MFLSRLIKVSGVDKEIYGGLVFVLDGEKYSMRLFVSYYCFYLNWVCYFKIF